MKNKKIIKLWLLTAIFSLFLVFIFNYYVDSLNIFGKNKYLNEAAKKLAKGEIIAGVDNLDERIFQKTVILNLQNEPNFVTIGSSRIMQIRKSTINRSSFHNYGVSGASLEDYIALVQIHYQKFGKYPKNVIFGVDPWIFNKNNDQNRYKSILSDYLALKNRLFSSKKSIERSSYSALKLLSIQYTIQNIKSLKKDKLYVATDTNIDAYLREPDGSLHYPFKFRYPSPDEVKKEALKYAKENVVYSLRDFKYLDTELFEVFIKFLISQGVKVYFFLPAYNPYTYDLLMQNPKYHIIKEVELYLKNFAKANSIKTIGSYDPSANKLKNEDFFDGMHFMQSGYTKVFKDLDLD